MKAHRIYQCHNKNYQFSSLWPVWYNPIMNANPRTAIWLALLATVLLAFALLASCAPAVSGLAGQWHGKHHFTGISYKEATQKKVAPQDVDIVLHISADGKVTGRLGGAQLSDCVVELNRGWIGRMINIKTDYVIRGRIIGAVATGSDTGTNTISAPFNLVDGHIKGSVFAMHPFTYPYPILGLRLSREP
ncbi:MAG TPA: hypothetical protein VF988_02075 [Verrucomicrobiae bacterium]